MKNYTITVNGSVYDVVVEEGAGTGVAAPVHPRQHLQHLRLLPQQHLRQLLQQQEASK